MAMSGILDEHHALRNILDLSTDTHSSGACPMDVVPLNSIDIFHHIFPMKVSHHSTNDRVRDLHITLKGDENNERISFLAVHYSEVSQTMKLRFSGWTILDIIKKHQVYEGQRLLHGVLHHSFGLFKIRNRCAQELLS